MKSKYLAKTEKYINENALKNSSSYILEKNNILLSIYATIGVPMINLIDVAIPQSILGIKLYKNYNLEFIYYLFLNSSKMFYFISEKGSQSNISLKNIKKLFFFIPSLLEQQKIAKFFSLLDKQIELWQTKLQLSELIFKYYLNKIISKENYPKFRFKGFNDNWKLSKLCSLCKIRTGNRDVMDKCDNGEYPFYVRSQKIEKINDYALDCEAILIPGDGRIGDIFHYVKGKFNFHQRVYCISNYNGCLKFIYYEFKKNLKKYIINFSAKATVDSIRLPMLLNYQINLPKFIEQKKIIYFLDLLEYNKKKINNYIDIIKKIKVFYLNSLFK